MPTIEVTIRDDDGKIINSRNVKKYQFDLGKQSFHELEGAVEKFKRSALPDIEADLLEATQNAFISDKKRLNLQWHDADYFEDFTRSV